MIGSVLQPFDDFPEEGVLIGRILIAYGELDFELCICLGAALRSLEAAVRTLYRLRGEDSRLQVADALMREHFHSVDLKNEYEAMLGAIRWSKSLRNQYAHCHWIAYGDGLFFTDLDKVAKTAIGQILHQFWNVDVPLLKRQEEFLDYTSAWLTYLRQELEKRTGQSASNFWTTPPITEPPPLYNPPETHPFRMSQWHDSNDEQPLIKAPTPSDH